MNLYDQLTQLQIIPGAYEMWYEYREALTDYLLSEVQKEDRVAIIGAGRCNDIDLGQIIKGVGKLIIVDKDLEAMKGAIKQYELSANPKIECLTKNIIGLSVQDYRQYAEHMVSAVRRKGLATSIESLVQIALVEINTLVSQMIISRWEKGQFDVVITIGLHSQLLSMIEWIWQVILQTLGKQEETVRQYLMNVNEKLVCALNTAILEATTKKWIVGCELERNGKPGTIQGAVQALEDISIRRAYGELRLKSAIELEWPFDKVHRKAYQMLIQSLYI